MLVHLPEHAHPSLHAVVSRLAADGVVPHWWTLADRNSLRAGVNDHGPTHVKIVVNLALKLQRLLAEAGVAMAVERDHGLGEGEAQTVVLLAAMLHDLGMNVHRDGHEAHSLFMAHEYLMDALTDLFPPAVRVTVVCEALHAIIAHSSHNRCLTPEAGIVKLADALDMTRWRSRQIIKAGRVSIHSLSAAAIDKVVVERGKVKPVGIEILMNSSAGIFQVDSLLKHKLLKSGIQDYIEVSAHIEGPARREHLPVYNL